MQLFDDFKEKKVSECFGAVKPEHKGGYHFGNLWHCLPTFVCESLVEGIDAFGRRSKVMTDPMLFFQVLKREHLHRCEYREMTF